MEANYVAKNVGAKVCIYDKYITIKESFISKEVMIPFKEISSVESGILRLEINTKDKRSYKVSLQAADKKKIREMIYEKISE